MPNLRARESESPAHCYRLGAVIAAVSTSTTLWLLVLRLAHSEISVPALVGCGLVIAVLVCLSVAIALLPSRSLVTGQTIQR